MSAIDPSIVGPPSTYPGPPTYAGLTGGQWAGLATTVGGAAVGFAIKRTILATVIGGALGSMAIPFLFVGAFAALGNK